MKVSDSKGLAHHTVPESCAVHREVRREALTGVRVGQPLSRERVVFQGADAFGSAIDERTTRHEGYRVSLRIRKRIEEVFGWIKTVGNLRKTRHRGVPKVDWYFTLDLSAYNLVRMRNLGVSVS